MERQISESARRRRASHDHEEPSADVVAQALKERVYASFSGLAIVLVLRGHEPTAQVAMYSLFIGVLGITVAGFAADVIAHLAAHASLPSGIEMRKMVRIAGGAFSTAGVPLVLLVISWIGWMPLDAALLTAAIVYLATLGLVGYAAVRRAGLSWWMQLLALLALVVLGAIVVGLQLLAHA